jgi:phosphoglycerol transferase MdoB-like AlkP superfamily enzyme
VADEELFRLLPTAPRRPSLTALLTLSSHEPWDVPEPGKSGGSRIKYNPLQDARRNAFAYTDACLGSLLDSLSRTPSWDSLLVVVVADHGVPVDGLQPDGKHLATRIPILWVGGAVKQPRTIDCLMNQSDLAATLLAQLGLADSSFRFSRNVLAPSYRFPFAVNAYKNGLYYIDTTGVTAYDCLSLSETDAAYPSDTLRLQRTQALLQLWYTTTGRLR